MDKQEAVVLNITRYDKLSAAEKEDLQDAYDKYHENLNSMIKDLAAELGVSEQCASDVWYLRSRNRHTPELEAELIRHHKEGIPVNIYEFGVSEQTQKTLMDEVEKRLKDQGVDTDS